jgi:hypothetical protein
MVHGDCSSRGCYAMTDEQIQEIYALARESFFGGQKAFQLQAFPFRMTPLNMAKHRNNPNFAFWKMLKEGYDHFNATHREPNVAVCDRRYVFDAAAPDDSGRSLSFNPKGACPTYQLDKTIADAVLDQRRQEQYKMAEYIARNVETVPSRAGVDGGMNPVFLAKLSPQAGFDNNGRSYQVASVGGAPGVLPRVENAPGALPRDTTPPAAAAATPKPTPAVVKTTEPVVAAASTPTPRSAPQQAKQGEAPAPEQQKPTTIAGLIGSWFKGSKTETPSPENEQAVARSANDAATKSKRATPVRTATPTPVQSAQAVPAAKQREASPKPAEPTVRVAAPTAPAVQTAKAEPPQQPEIRTAYTTPPASNNGLLTGAQPVVPVGSFNSFR